MSRHGADDQDRSLQALLQENCSVIRRLTHPLRDGLLNTEIFYMLKEATIMIEQGRWHDNAFRPHSSLGYQPLAPETIALDRPRLQSESASWGR